MSKKTRKKIFEVQENETINDCLERITKEGFMPVRRMDKPIFKEVVNNGEVDYEPAGAVIQFEAKPID
ncbi:NETI motif-containing protein [Bacillus sp. B15-48]|uniref:NETI motif-containing protein n=1 Tax=Bacillus sp. B15-48 TaxID=1548601 RepID=UPI00193ED11C|nr:NETI motif-containing protein [Bacillus sp. B15-48]MBM4764565.1 NETI motif-containing protein [Bacillus sp. B15-48]